MMKTDFLPRRDGDLYSFEENFLNKIDSFAPALGLDAAEVTSVKNIIDAHRTAFSNMVSRKAESKSSTEENILRKDAAVSELRRISAKIRACSNYTPVIGDALGIIGPDFPGVSAANVKPELKAKVVGDTVVISFKKNGTDGVKIYSRRGSETEFSFLAIDTASPYNDSRAKSELSKPENREYFAQYFDDETDIGMRSDIIKVTLQ